MNYQESLAKAPKTPYPQPSGIECARKQSECEAAYQHLRTAQEELSESVAELQGRLAPVMSDRDGGAESDPSQVPSSEVHGWLIAAQERVSATARAVRAITASLTI